MATLGVLSLLLLLLARIVLCQAVLLLPLLTMSLHCQVRPLALLSVPLASRRFLRTGCYPCSLGAAGLSSMCLSCWLTNQFGPLERLWGLSYKLWGGCCWVLGCVLQE